MIVTLSGGGRSTTLDVPAGVDEVYLYFTPADDSGMKRLVYRRVAPDRFEFVTEEPFALEPEKD